MTVYCVYIQKDDKDRLKDVLHLWDNSICDKLAVCFDACPEEMVEEYTDQSPPPFHCFVNEKNPEGFSKCVNRAIKAFPGEDFVILTDLFFPNIPDTDIRFEKEYFYIKGPVIDKIGGFCPLYKDQMHLLDYAKRAQTAGFTISVSDEIISQELPPTPPGWPVITFGTMWGVPEEKQPYEFWDYVSEAKYEWSEQMKV